MRRTLLFLVLCLGAGLWAPAPASATAPYVRLRPALSTPWTSSVSPTLPLPEYPRPQFERTEWLNLNGRWQYEATAPGRRPPFGRSLAQTILVPYPVESPLSGIGREDLSGFYRREFVVPAAWRNRDVVLNFGAVAWAATVWVNGRLAGRHLGDYDPFSFDITRRLRPSGPNELVVGFSDPIGAAGEPVGKQVPGIPFSFYHSASSGIWQTVWLEPVARVHVEALALAPDLRRGRLVISAEVAGAARGVQLQAAAYAGGRRVAVAAAAAGRALVLALPRARLWSPADPFLYALHLQVVTRGRVTDRVSSYFGMRSVSLGRVGGVTRILLNGRFLFQSGALDQSMWPDGYYTAPTDRALRFDIDAARRLGFNMLRVHQVVEPDRWYYWADRLGMLVWQDMPGMALRSRLARQPAAQSRFRRELAAVLRARRNHPAIVAWVPFNEGWDAFDPAGITRLVKGLDPTRLVDTDSGSANDGGLTESPESDVRDAHVYFGPFAVPPDRRASVAGEFGASLPIPPAGHRWPLPPTSVGSPAGDWPDGVIRGLVQAEYANLAVEVRHGGLSAASFTELTATEQETGLITYDRRLTLLPGGLLRRLNQEAIGAAAPPPDPQAVLPGHRRPPGPPVSPAGAVAAWEFDEARGSVAWDAVGHQPLLLVGGAGWTRGVHGSALHLTRAGAAALAGTALIDPRRSFTVGAWLASDRLHPNASAVSEPGGAGSAFSLGLFTATVQGSPRSWWGFEAPDRSTCTLARCADQASLHFGDGRYAPGRGRWHYVVGVYDAPAETVSLYVDGLGQDVEHVRSPPRASGALEVGRGAISPPAPDTFLGAVDDLRLYQRALSPTEVWDLYQASRAG